MFLGPPDFKPVTVARGISYRIGDGISNLC
jgi:hypothetical protein